jgi:DNA-binding transcriptional MocR family regulator
VATVYSERVVRLFPSPVREILKAASGANVASLAGGLPAEETFPVLSGLPTGWGQYGLTEGDADFRRAVSEHLEERGLHCPPERILATNGSQQGIDLAAKLFVDVGTPVACESPTYIAALQVLRLFGADLRGLPLSGKDGPEPESVEPFLSQADFRLAYAIPTYHNPTGAVWSEDAREAFARAADRRGIPVLEDDPYREIGFGTRPPRPVCSRLRRAPWMFLGSFSKSFMPGLRLGFLAASAELFTSLERLKQAADLHSCRLSQALVLADLRDRSRPKRLDALRGEYRRRRDAFDASLRRHFPHAEFASPDGGLFFWARLARELDLRSIAPLALARGVAFLPGEHCFAEMDPPKGWARLNFSNAAPEVADRALAVLAEVVGDAV